VAKFLIIICVHATHYQIIQLFVSGDVFVSAGAEGGEGAPLGHSDDVLDHNQRRG